MNGAVQGRVSTHIRRDFRKGDQYYYDENHTREQWFHKNYSCLLFCNLSTTHKLLKGRPIQRDSMVDIDRKVVKFGQRSCRRQNGKALGTL
jgi:hypothetical protein